MKTDTVQQVKDRLSITDVVGGYVKLARSGASLKARCPFHAEKTPSFHVSPERGTYHCFGCGEGGDIFTFVEKMEGLDFKGALKVLAERAGVPLVYAHGEREEKDERDRLFALLEAAALFYSSRLSDEAREYLRGRGLTDATISHFRIGLAGSGWSDAADHLRGKGYSEKEITDDGLAKRSERGSLLDRFRNRIMFPLSDSAGRVIGFSGRSFGADASPEAPKYLNSPETPLFRKSRVLFGLDKAKAAMRTLGCALLVEGQVDLIMAHQAGWENAVAASGTAFTAEHAALVKRFTDNLIIALDADEAGVKAAGKAARAALAQGFNVKVARLPAGLDPADFILKEGADAWKEKIRSAKDIIEFLLDVLQERFGGSDDRLRRAVEAAVLPFVKEAASPIARERYVRLIAGRLGVSEGAVAEALARVPSLPDEPLEREMERSDTREPLARGDARANSVFGIILWQESLGQESLAQSEIDAAGARADLAEAIGPERFALLEALPEGAKEALRFEAERLHASARSLSQDCAGQIALLLRERLSRELVEITARLRRAEAGEHNETKDLVEQSRALTARIALLHAAVYTG